MKTVIPSILIESFLLLFKENQEAAIEEILERFKDICCLTIKKSLLEPNFYNEVDEELQRLNYCNEILQEMCISS